MKRNVISLIILFSLTSVIYCQDIVYLGSENKIECKVIAIHPDTVEIQPSDSTAKRYIDKSKIRAIKYENGKMQFFDDQGKKDETSTDKKVKNLENRINENDKKEAHQSGIVTGIGICCGIVLILAIL